ncbi:hypothetical protein P4T20_15010 [Aneurinibacillus thermoaerophilus]|uniref:hypothetical protein n=1 Tax=Aneurinibacillus thermoaerophilus TaxID=143495 RepID=UPI002E2092AE|nr:hypothetical protein [Aneurinibacillus thermoaerophilus]
MNKYFPQAGILTSLNLDKAEGKVMIPLLQHETDWCPIAKNLLEEEKIVLQNPVVGSGVMDLPPDAPPIVFEDIKSDEMTAEKIKFGSLSVGDEVLVVFLNGDIHQPVITARL